MLLFGVIQSNSVHLHVYDPRSLAIELFMMFQPTLFSYAFAHAVPGVPSPKLLSYH